MDPAQIALKTSTDVRIYFIGENVSKNNALGFNVDARGLKGGDPQLIFPSIATRDTGLLSGDPNDKIRKKNDPLVPGDFVDLGKVSAGKTLDFFLISDSDKKNPGPVWSSDSSVNADGLAHAIAFYYPGNPYLILSFEDTQSSRGLDFNDNMFALDIGGIQNLLKSGGTPTPEPSTVSLLMTFIFLTWWLTRYRKII